MRPASPPGPVTSWVDIRSGSSRRRALTDLKGELASLRIDRDRPVRSPCRWPLLLMVPVLIALAALYSVRARAALRATEVQTASAALSSGGSAVAGSPVLAASGYMVSRPKRLDSGDIEGALTELRAEA